MVMRQYNTDIGYITIPEAVDRVINELKIPHTQQNWNREYRRILKLVNTGRLNAKKHGKRIHQVEMQEIDDYIEERLISSK